MSVVEEGAHRPGREQYARPGELHQVARAELVVRRDGGHGRLRANLTGRGDPEEIVAQNVEAQFFPDLGVSPLVGRTFTDEENRDPQAAS